MWVRSLGQEDTLEDGRMALKHVNIMYEMSCQSRFDAGEGERVLALESREGTRASRRVEERTR